MRKDGKQLARKTDSNLSTEGGDCCSLCFKIVLGNDNLFYIKPKKVTISDDPNYNRLHTNHIQVPKEDRQYMTRHLRATDLKLISDCETAGFSTQMTSSLLLAVTKKKWLSSQVKYVLTRAEKNIIRNDIPDSKLSSASKLINYLEGQADLVYVTLTDTHDEGILVRTKRKGRPTTEEKLERLKGTDSYKTICENLKITGTPEILLACAWMTEEELRLLTIFPEIWFADVTN